MKNVKKVGIYKIISPTDYIYIGQGKDILRRWGYYRRLDCKNQTKLYDSFLKHGVENHIFEILEECSEHKLNCKERYWQDKFDVLNGLNLVLTECNDKTHIDSEYTRNKRSEAQSGNKSHMWGKKGILHQSFGKKRTHENKELMRELLSGKNNYRAQKVIDVKTQIIYDTIKEASIKNNIKYSTLKYYLINEIKNKTNLKYYLHEM